MRWAIKHKSGRTLFVTSDEFIANNRRKMGWIVEEVKMTSRGQFEKEMSDKYEWFSDAIACADFCGDDDDGYYVGGDYIYHGTSCSEALFWLWRGWQASRAAIEIESPDFIDSRAALNKGYTVDYSNGFGDAMDAYEMAIEQAGLEVKK